MKKLALALLAIVLVLTSAIGAYAAGDYTALSISLVNQDPNPALAGGIVEVRLGVENVGGASASDVKIELTPEYPFTLVPGESAVQEIGTIGGYQQEENMKIVKYRLQVDRNALATSYDLNLKVTYTSDSDITPVEMKKSLSLDVKSKEFAEIIYIDKAQIVPGEQTNMRFTINNLGSAPLRDLKGL